MAERGNLSDPASTGTDLGPQTAPRSTQDPARGIVDGSRPEPQQVLVESLRPFIDGCVRLHDALVEAYPLLVAHQAALFADLLRQSRQHRERR